MFVDAWDLELALAALPEEAWSDWSFQRMAEAMMDYLTTMDEDSD